MRLSPFVAVPLCGFLLCLPAMPQQQNPPQQAPQPQPAAPQNPGEQPATRIHVQVNEVIVPVTVTDDQGKFVSNLTVNDFRVLDEGRPQAIRFFSHSQKQPVVVGFLLDLSNASRIHWDKYKDAVDELVWGLLPGDKKYTGYLITYSSDAEVAVNTTWDGEKITDKISKLKPGGGSALYDAIYLACTKRDLINGEPYEPRRVIIIIGDGHDSASNHTLDQVLELAQRNLVTIYAVSTQAFGFANESQDVLEKLTGETGGHVEYPLNTLYKDVSGYLSTPSDEGNYALKVGTGAYAAEISGNIIKAVGQLAGEIETQYVLRYTPNVDATAKPRDFRRIKVEIPSLSNVRIYARSGYYPNGVEPPATDGQPGGTPAAQPNGQQPPAEPGSRKQPQPAAQPGR
jgi:Ca-activated chloride channel family protein